MVAGDDPVGASDADRALDSAPTASTGPVADEGSAAVRGEAPRPAQQLQPSWSGAHDRVVATDVDRPVVLQQTVDQWAEPRRCVVVVVGDGFVAEIPAGHHQRPRRRRPAAGDAAGCTAASRPVRADLGRRRRRRRRRLGGGRGRSAGGSRSAPARLRRRGAQVRAPHRATATITANGLSSRCLAAAQLGDRGIVGGVGHQVVAADPLHGDDATRRRAPRRRGALPTHRDRRAGARHRVARRAAGRTRGRRSAGRGSAGRRGRRTPPGSAHTW